MDSVKGSHLQDALQEPATFLDLLLSEASRAAANEPVAPGETSQDVQADMASEAEVGRSGAIASGSIAWLGVELEKKQ